MKNYRFLIPIILVILFATSIYVLYDANATEEQTYQQYLAEARKYRAMEIYVDAEAYYAKALDMRPSLELYKEIGELYDLMGSQRKILDWGEEIVDAYPEAAEGYEILIRTSLAKEDYVTCYEWYDAAQKRNVTSSYISNAMQSIEWTYYLTDRYDEALIYSEGFCPVADEGLWGFANVDGDNQVSCKYQKVGVFSGGVAPVVDADGNAYYIDSKGNKKFVILNVENVTELGVMINGIYALYNGTSWGFYNKDYEYLFGGYDETSALGNGYAAARIGNQWQLIDATGTAITDDTFDSVVQDEKTVVYRNDRFFVEKNAQYYMMDTSGNCINQTAYQNADLFNNATYAAVMINGLWGFVDKDGKIVIEPQYQEAKSFSNGLAAVKINGKWGYIDESGELVIEASFEDANDFNDHGGAFVFDGKYWKLLCLYKMNH